MTRLKISLIAFTLLLGSFAKADEGMWLPFLLGRNYEDMKAHGLNLTEQEIYDINNSSLLSSSKSSTKKCMNRLR